MTNDEQINIYNNIQNLYNMDFKTWQEVLAMMYNLVADTSQKFEAFEQKFDLMLGSEVTKAIKELYENGSLTQIINSEVFKNLNSKIDYLKVHIEKTRKEINEQLESKASNYITCSSLNMSLTDGNKNFTILKNIIDKGIPLLIDDFYPLTFNETLTITKDLNFLAIEKSHGFNVNTPLINLFDLKNSVNINIKNIKLDFNNSCYLFVYKSKVIINDFIIENCVFNKNIKLLTSMGQIDGNTNPIDNFYGFGNIRINNNYFVECNTNIIYLDNVPHNNFIIDGNHITNINGVFAVTKPDNDVDFCNEIFNAKRNFIVKNNFVKNDDNYPIFTKDVQYFIFVVAKCNNAEYYNNNIYGLKCEYTNQSMPLEHSDSYFICNELKHYNNKIKNCVRFSNKHNIMATSWITFSKGNGNYHFYNNEYIIEEKFINKLGKNVIDTAIYLFNNVTSNANILIENCKIDVPYLCSLPSPLLRQFELKNNSIKCNYFEGALFNLPNNVIYSDSSYRLNGNNITIGNLKSNIILFNRANDGVKVDRVEIKNNYINVTLDGNIATPRLVNNLTNIRTVAFSGNKITNNTNGNLGIVAGNLYNIDNLKLIANTRTIGKGNLFVNSINIGSNIQYEVNINHKNFTSDDSETYNNSHSFKQIYSEINEDTLYDGVLIEIEATCGFNYAKYHLIVYKNNNTLKVKALNSDSSIADVEVAYKKASGGTGIAVYPTTKTGDEPIYCTFKNRTDEYNGIFIILKNINSAWTQRDYNIKFKTTKINQSFYNLV